MNLKFSLYLFLFISLSSCKNKQKQASDLVENKNKQKHLKNKIDSLNIESNTLELYIRCFKAEELVEVWLKNKGDFKKMTTYPLCQFSGELGPKRKQGDKQIPEGIYYINRFNPESKFHLSLGLNYPNPSDILFADKNKPGGDIFIHGGCLSLGCLAITDEKITELYQLAEMVTEKGQQKIRVDIYPMDFSDQDRKENFYNYYEDEKFMPLWKSLEAIFWKFEFTKSIPPVELSSEGYYVLKDLLS